ncbi:MAG: hypothetical protein ACR2GH_04270 [Pseudonocardia sp.]
MTRVGLSHRFGMRVAVSLLVVAVGAGLLAADAARTARSYRFQVDGVGPVTVTAPREAGRPTVTALPMVDPAQLPLATVLLALPVEIDARPFDDPAQITFSYDPATVPPGADPLIDMVVLTRLAQTGVWVPVDTRVDPSTHTASAITTHFSPWAIAITDPEQLRDEKALTERLENTAGGTLASWVAGERATLDCDPRHVLLPATQHEVTALNPRLCQELMDDGSYRLQYVNTSGMPRVLQLPPGFVREDSWIRSTNQVIGDALSVRHPGRAVVLDGESLSLRFRDADLLPDTRITGDTDWSIYMVSMFRLVMAAALLDEVPEGTDLRALEEKLDGILLAGDLWDCLDKGSDELRKSGDWRSAAVKVLKSCAKEAVQAMLQVLETFVAASRNVVAFLEKRVLVLLDVPKLMELARAEMNGLMQATGKYGFGLDTSVTITPARVMSFADAVTLPPSALWSGDVRELRCGPSPEGVTVPGALSGSCFATVTADLDGNGAPDRLVLWRPREVGLFPREWKLTDVGAVAFLDDGTFHLLEDPPSRWPDSVYGEAELFEATRVVQLGADRREQVVVAVTVGANTTHHVVLAVGSDHRLRTLTTASESGPFRLAVGGGTGYTSDFGCVTSAGQPLLAMAGSVTHWDEAGGASAYGWSRQFYRLDDVRLQYVGREGGVASESPGPGAGSYCVPSASSDRGPEIGVPGVAGETAEQTAREFLSAVLDGDRSRVSRYLAGTDIDPSWADGAGVDAWVQARATTQTSRAAWQDATLQCSTIEVTYGGALVVTCAFVSTAQAPRLFLRLRGAPPEGWTVAGALGA